MRKVLPFSFLFLCLAGLAFSAKTTCFEPMSKTRDAVLSFETTGPFIWHLDTPQAGDTVSGIVMVQGWILSEVGVSRIDFYVDDKYVSTANINLPRDDVIEHYPEFAGSASAAPGFTVGFLASDYPMGNHEIFLIVTDSEDHQETIGTRTVYVDPTLNPGLRSLSHLRMGHRRERDRPDRGPGGWNGH